MRPAFLRLALLSLTFLPAVAAGAPEGDPTIVFATVHNGYQRVTRPDGTPQPVTYVFGEGNYDGGALTDPSLDRLKFNDLIKLLAGPLARQGFQPGTDPHQLDQLIVVHWGRTTGWDSGSFGMNFSGLNNSIRSSISSQAAANFGKIGGGNLPGGHSGPSTSSLYGDAADADLTMINLQNRERDEADARNARLLGYYDKIDSLNGTFGALNGVRNGLLEEIEDDRYYVVLIAYDFPTLLQTKQRKVLWITRFSLTARGTRFDDNIEGMIKSASKYFGRSSDGLKRHELREGHVNPGPVRVLEYDEPKSR